MMTHAKQSAGRQCSAVRVVFGERCAVCGWVAPPAYLVNGQGFEEKREAVSYAKVASGMFSGLFTVTQDGEPLAEFKGGRRHTANI